MKKENIALPSCASLLVPAGPGLWLAHWCFLLLTRHDSSHAPVLSREPIQKRSTKSTCCRGPDCAIILSSNSEEERPRPPRSSRFSPCRSSRTNKQLFHTPQNPPFSCSPLRGVSTLFRSLRKSSPKNHNLNRLLIGFSH